MEGTLWGFQEGTHVGRGGGWGRRPRATQQPGLLQGAARKGCSTKEGGGESGEMGGHRDSELQSGDGLPRLPGAQAAPAPASAAARLCWRPGGRRGRIMARWLRDRLLFRSAKPAPPQPDYTPGPDQPDLLAAYRLQRELDFEDPYTGGAAPPSAEGRRCRSPRRRLIRVELETAPAAPQTSDCHGQPEKVQSSPSLDGPRGAGGWGNVAGAGGAGADAARFLFPSKDTIVSLGE